MQDRSTTPIVAIVVIVGVLIGCSPQSVPRTDGPVDFELVAGGAPMGGADGRLQPGEPAHAVVHGGDSLPDQTRQWPSTVASSLARLSDEPGPAMYVAVYGGRSGSGGVTVTIDEMELHDGRLVVRWHLHVPRPGMPTIATPTYPHAIAKVTDPRALGLDPARMDFERGETESMSPDAR